jgi:CTP:molybdopterin cytidylyltransferase MocA
MIPPLAILQARLHSTRLEGKMLLPLKGKPLLRWAWEATVDEMGPGNAVIAIPSADAAALRPTVPSATWFEWAGPEWDVLGRLHACAHALRSHPHTVIVRVTPEDWPVDLSRERFTLAALDEAQAMIPADDQDRREHVAYALFPDRGPMSIDTPSDYRAAQRAVGDV